MTRFSKSIVFLFVIFLAIRVIYTEIICASIKNRVRGTPQMMIAFKPSFIFATDEHSLHPRILREIPKIREVFDRNGIQAIFTSGLDEAVGRLATTLHDLGRAVDLRSFHIASEAKKKKIRDELQEALGPDFDVLYETTKYNEFNELVRMQHFHIELDKKM